MTDRIHVLSFENTNRYDTELSLGQNDTLNSIVSVDWDSESDVIFWGDSSKRTINSGSLNVSYTTGTRSIGSCRTDGPKLSVKIIFFKHNNLTSHMLTIVTSDNYLSLSVLIFRAPYTTFLLILMYHILRV